MIKFNPENKEKLTYAECLNPAMEITDPAEAKQYLRDYIAFIQKYLDKEPRGDNVTAEEIAKKNLGYWTGYQDNKTAARVMELFDCSHPIFGKARPSAKDAFEAGKKMGSKKRV